MRNEKREIKNQRSKKHTGIYIHQEFGSRSSAGGRHRSISGMLQRPQPRLEHYDQWLGGQRSAPCFWMILVCAKPSVNKSSSKKNGKNEKETREDYFPSKLLSAAPPPCTGLLPSAFRCFWPCPSSICKDSSIKLGCPFSDP